MNDEDTKVFELAFQQLHMKFAPEMSADQYREAVKGMSFDDICKGRHPRPEVDLHSRRHPPMLGAPRQDCYLDIDPILLTDDELARLEQKRAAAAPKKFLGIF